MRVGSIVLKRRTGLILLLAVTTAGRLSNARPIEFSEPTQSNSASPVSSLGTKTSDLSEVEDRLFKPHTYKSPRDANFKMQRPPAGPVNPQRNVTPGPFDREENWMQLAPDKRMMKMWERDTLKLPSSEPRNSLSDHPSSWDPFNIARRKDSSRNDSRNGPGDLNRPNNAGDPFNLNQVPPNQIPGQIPGRGLVPEVPVESPSELLEQKQQADRLEEFKKSLNPPLQTVAPLPNGLRLPTPVVNAYVSDPNNLTRLPNGMPRPSFELPKVPVAPLAPFAPGQNSLTPSTYSPSVKIKPVKVNATRRNF